MPCDMSETIDLLKEIDKVVKEDSSKLNYPYQTHQEDHIEGECPIILALLIFIIIATIGLTVFIVNQI